MAFRSLRRPYVYSLLTNCYRRSPTITSTDKGAAPVVSLHSSGPPAAPERVRRAAVESIVSSTRFRARLALDVPSIAGACTVDWFAEKGLLALGSKHGESIIRLAPGPQRGNDESLRFRVGPERRNSFNISWENSQVSGAAHLQWLCLSSLVT